MEFPGISYFSHLMPTPPKFTARPIHINSDITRGRKQTGRLAGGNTKEGSLLWATLTICLGPALMSWQWYFSIGVELFSTGVRLFSTVCVQHGHQKLVLAPSHNLTGPALTSWHWSMITCLAQSLDSECYLISNGDLSICNTQSFDFVIF